MMMKAIYLNWQYDLDLISLALHPDFNFSEWMKRALIAWARDDENFVIPLPKTPISQPVKIDKMRKSVAFMDYEEADVVKKISEIRKGFQNCAMKMIFRSYLERPYIEPFYDSENYITRAKSGRPPLNNKNSSDGLNGDMMPSRKSTSVGRSSPKETASATDVYTGLPNNTAAASPKNGDNSVPSAVEQMNMLMEMQKQLMQAQEQLKQKEQVPSMEEIQRKMREEIESQMREEYEQKLQEERQKTQNEQKEQLSEQQSSSVFESDNDDFMEFDDDSYEPDSGTNALAAILSSLTD